MPTKKYNYYVDNFEDSKKKEPRSTSGLPERATLGGGSGATSKSDAPTHFTKNRDEEQI